MKCNIVKKWKVIIVSVMAVLLVGMAMLGIFNFNNSAEYGQVSQLKVSVSQKLQNSDVKAIEGTEKYLKDKGISQYSFGNQILDEGRTAVYEIKADTVDTAELQSLLTNKINNENVVVTVTLSKVTAYNESQAGLIALALALTALVVFVVLLFVEKWKSALSVILTAILSALLFIATMSIVRIPAKPFLAVSLSVALLLGVSLSTVITLRYKELLKNPANSGKSIADVANEGVINSLLRLCFVCGAVVLGAVLIAVLCSGYAIFLGLQLVLATLVACASSVFVTPVIWAVLNDKKALS